ncbi:MAG: hypothetical protein H6619_03650 [Deltaproteobacteria bacterium]|nr:hypothetical protein [Deltaproteobacteria bacterium]
MYLNKESDENLEDIIGKENAQFYKEQRKKAFQNSENEALEKELYYLSRKLDLKLEQELQIEKSLFSLKERAKDKNNANVEPTTPQEKLQAYMEQTKRENDILRKDLEAILSKEQYEQYLLLEAESSAAQVGVWH